MSKKTLRKRISLVAVFALGSSLMTLAPANANTISAATVIAAANNNTTIVSDVNPVLTDGALNIASELSATGITFADATAAIDAKSIGLLSLGDIAGTRVAGTTQTATMLSTGTLTVMTATASSTAGMITVTGGTIVNRAPVAAITAFAADSKAIGITASAGVALVGIKPDSGATSMTIKLFNSNTSGVTGPKLLSGENSGTLTGQINVTVTAASAAGVLAPSKSGVYYASDTSFDATATSDGTNSGSTDFSREISLLVRARDAYSSPVYGVGILSVSATGGAHVSIGSTAGTGPTAFLARTVSQEIDGEEITVSNPTANPVASTVTVSWNGTVIGTKTVGFSGEVAKVTLSSPVIGKTGGTANLATYALFDAAGNQVYTKYSGSTNNATPVSGLAGDASLYNTIVSSVARDGTNPDSDLNLTTGVLTKGKIAFSCTQLGGSTTIGVTYINTSGTTVKSNALPVSCAGDAVSYKASYDKATYRPGEVATLTVQFLDSKGRPANDITDVETGNHTVSVAGVTVITGPSTVSGSDSADKLSQGAIKYTYSVGINEGGYTNKIDFPTVNTAGASISTEAATATLSVASGAVGLADVLKSMVSLIASINKQIQALQKLILRR